MAKWNKIGGTLIVLFMLIGLPAISYYYLSQGYAYRKEAILAQGAYGTMPDLGGLTPVRGKLPEELRGAMTVVGWLDPSQSRATQQYGKMLDSVYQQFADSPNLYFTTLVKGDDPSATATEFALTYNLPLSPMLSFLAADAAAFNQTARDFALPLPGSGQAGEMPIVALVDSSLTIVKHYDLADRQQTIGLVQLISLIIPLPEKADIIVERKKEL
ncbi:hypothetical protein QWY85_09525 [Neolewinella lacunae]|uniref:Uncharacterized protein n=1 Tax=Neolewinella lacunae TaxID=1517758 RepID=A0A923TAT9_9BACT|nr:hypothetical protein [Neolewinella lacunae]MBC6996538.1 hypothetical protein [Neolewinella lacunae]MDN3634897.1 hypothetical protein [Neolewinella lacunae]